MAHTTTALDLRVVAEIAKRSYEKSRRATARFLEIDPIRNSRFLLKLNYIAPCLTLLSYQMRKVFHVRL